MAATDNNVPAAQTGLILFGHGARDVAWAEPMQRTRDALLQRHPDVHVALAFLHFIPPTLEEAVDAMAARDVSRIVIVPMFLAQSGHLKRDLPSVLAAAQRKHPGCIIEQTVAIGEAEALVQAMADFAGQAIAL